jgi:autotransporter translocation and assembly factor TamB
VFVNVSGTPDRYQITLASDPPTSEQNIVSLLSVGVSYEEYQTSGAGISSDQMLALAAQQLLGSQVQSYTGLDIGVDNSRGQPFLKASREVRKDLNLALFRGISDPTLAAELEYGLVRYMAVYVDWSNFAGQKDAPPSGGYGAGLRLKIEYR